MNRRLYLITGTLVALGLTAGTGAMLHSAGIAGGAIAVLCAVTVACLIRDLTDRAP